MEPQADEWKTPFNLVYSAFLLFGMLCNLYLSTVSLLLIVRILPLLLSSVVRVAAAGGHTSGVICIYMYIYVYIYIYTRLYPLVYTNGIYIYIPQTKASA